MNNLSLSSLSSPVPPPPCDPRACVRLLPGNESASSAVSSADNGTLKFDPNCLSAEGLMLYLSTRLHSIDKQINAIFGREQNTERVQGVLRKIREELSTLNVGPNGEDEAYMQQEFPGKIQELLDQFGDSNQWLADDIKAHMQSDGQLFADKDTEFNKAQLDATKNYLEMVSKDLESGSSMDMITLQSLTSGRQTAVQLATSLIAALADSMKAIVGNMRG